ncbi:MAG TPA: FAD-dependent oxidoreductase [Steroidobacteraceae bacterium]|nr:FAD-dependent oxidoreductase [Steroidobacteraceae bacterium]
MPATYRHPRFPYRTPPELASPHRAHHPVVVVGAGPVGLAAAIDLRLKGLPVVLLDEDDTVSVGSRGLCYAKRSLEILDRLGCADPVIAKGVSWNVGRTFFRDREVYRFDLVPEPDHKRPGMVNLQQYYLEEYQAKRAAAVGVDVRWKNRVVAVAPAAETVVLQVETPDGTYELQTQWLIVADGARSPIRRMLGLDIEGKVFRDRFLIADVLMKADFPAERWFWFDPPFHPNQSVLLHRQADNVWRIDFQLGWDADPEAEKRPERVLARIKAMLGDDRQFELEWVSVYTFQCRRMAKFRHGRVLFVGDAAHQVSPFGARGANSGYQDADNLAWKLQLVVAGLAPARLLDTYDEERGLAADENILNSTRSTDFITPKSAISRLFRDAVLALAERHPFARRLVNSGRLSVPAIYADSTLNTADAEPFAGGMVPGSPMADAPIDDGGWLIDAVGGRFQLLLFVDDPAAVDRSIVDAFAVLSRARIPVDASIVARRAGVVANARVLVDVKGVATRRYDGCGAAVYLVRPDQHVAARWRRFDLEKVRAALARATCNDREI